MIAPNEYEEASPLHNVVPDSRPVDPRNLPPKSPSLDYLNEEPNVANEDSHTPLSTSTSSNVAASPVDGHASAPTQEPKDLKNLEDSKENVAQDLDTRVVSASRKAVDKPNPSRKRKVILILPKIIDASAPHKAGDALPPKKRKRGPAADGKKKTIRRKYTDREDDDGVVSTPSQ